MCRPGDLESGSWNRSSEVSERMCSALLVSQSVTRSHWSRYGEDKVYSLLYVLFIDVDRLCSS